MYESGLTPTNLDGLCGPGILSSLIEKWLMTFDGGQATQVTRYHLSCPKIVAVFTIGTKES